MRILGVSASRVLGSFDLIESVVLSSPTTANILFSSIPQGYKHLQLRTSIKTDQATFLWHGMVLRLNEDGTANSHSTHALKVASSSLTSTYSSQNRSEIGTTGGNNASNQIFNAAIVDILDYSSSTKNTTIRAFSGAIIGNNSVDWHLNFSSGAYFNTAAVTSLQVIAFNANAIAGSRFSLYGIRG